MTVVLVDTNALAYVLLDDSRLSSRAAEAIASAATAYVSVASFYEIGQKVRQRKWDAMAPYAADIADRVTRDGFVSLDLGAGVMTKASLMDWPHRDPFDRMIAAQALVLGVPLVSADRAFDVLPLTRIWD
nr:type II toxin-antitoxin system VapC family toxin [Jannaschia sp. Os4]